MRLALLLLVALAVAAGVVTFAAWRGVGETARAELLDRGRGLLPILVTALEESRERARESIESEQQRLLAVARRARTELTLPLGPARDRLEALAREEHVGRVYLLDAAGDVAVRLTLDRVEVDPDAPSGKSYVGTSVAMDPVDMSVADAQRTLRGPGKLEEASLGPTPNAYATTSFLTATVPTEDGGALVLSTSADHLEDLERGLGAAWALESVCRLPDVRSARLFEGDSTLVEAGQPPRPQDVSLTQAAPGARQSPYGVDPPSVELRLSTERVDALADAQRRQILLWGAMASAAALLSALLLARRERGLARQRAQGEAAAREQQRLAEMGVLTGLFVHEVSNPLNALGLQLEGVKRAAGAAAAEDILRVKATLGRVRTALESFLHVATPMEGRVGEAYDAERLARTVAELRAESPAAELLLEVAPEAQARTVAARVPVLDQALRNLLRNALQSAPAGSRVHVAWSAGSEGGVEVVVRDRGPGFPAQVLESGGDLGVPGLREGRREGHGLGLYLARRIVEGLGGRLSLANPSDGGAEVRAWLPARPDGSGAGA